MEKNAGTTPDPALEPLLDLRQASTARYRCFIRDRYGVARIHRLGPAGVVMDLDAAEDDQKTPLDVDELVAIEIRQTAAASPEGAELESGTDAALSFQSAGQVRQCDPVSGPDGPASRWRVAFRWVVPDPKTRRSMEQTIAKMVVDETERSTASVAPKSDGPQRRADATSDTSILLVVDDDPTIRMLVVHAVRPVKNTRVIEAGSITEARAAIREHQIAIVFLDVCLPDGKGPDLLEDLIARHPHAAAIVMTARPSTDLAVAAFRQHAFDFVTKPLGDLDTIRRMVAKALDIQALKRDRAALAGQLTSTVEALRQSRRELLSTIGRVAGGIVHEIDSPASALASYLALLSNDVLPQLETPSEQPPAGPLIAEIRAITTGAERSIQQILEVTESLRDLSNPVATHRDPVNLDAVVEHALKL